MRLGDDKSWDCDEELSRKLTVVFVGEVNVCKIFSKEPRVIISQLGNLVVFRLNIRYGEKLRRERLQNSGNGELEEDITC